MGLVMDDEILCSACKSNGIYSGKCKALFIVKDELFGLTRECGVILFDVIFYLLQTQVNKFDHTCAYRVTGQQWANNGPKC